MALWGEIPPVAENDAESDKIVDEILSSDIPLQFDAQELFEPIPHNFSKRKYRNEIKDPIVKHTMALKTYIRKMEYLIRQADDMVQNVDNEYEKKYILRSIPPIIQIPPFPINYPFQVKTNFPVLGKDTDSAYGVNTIRLPRDSVRKLLMRSIACILVQVGYGRTSEGILKVLCDIFEDYITKMLKLLKENIEEHCEEGSDFMNALNRTFHQLGLNGSQGVHEFYLHKVINVHDNLLAKCQNLYDKYKKYEIYGSAGEELESVKKVDINESLVNKAPEAFNSEVRETKDESEELSDGELSDEEIDKEAEEEEFDEEAEDEEFDDDEDAEDEENSDVDEDDNSDDEEENENDEEEDENDEEAEEKKDDSNQKAEELTFVKSDDQKKKNETELLFSTALNPEKGTQNITT